jgi:hypothetical protein
MACRQVRGGAVMSIHIPPAHIQHVLAQHPDLCIDGLRYVSTSSNSCYSDARFPERRAMFMKPEYLQQIVTACEYLNHFELDKRSGSYGLKHLMETWGRKNGLASYVTNGSAILAAILSGYQIVRTKYPSPNCTFRRPK